MEVSARLVNTLYAFVQSAAAHHSAETRFLRLADTDELLLLSHSLGGSVAFSVLTGQHVSDTLEADACIPVQADCDPWVVIFRAIPPDVLGQ